MSEPVVAKPLPYEFTPVQNELIGRLAYKLRGVGFFYFIMGLLSVVGGVAIGYAIYKDPNAMKASFNMYYVAAFYIISGFINLLIGSWTRGAGQSFRKIVDTKGEDIDRLMDALSTLHSVYSLLYTLILFALVAFLALVALTAYAAISVAKPD